MKPNIELGSHLNILAETEDLIAVFKPAGLHSAPLKPDDTSTVLNGVVAVRPECALVAGKKAIEGGLLHRLDLGTSGVLLFAKTQKAYDALRSLWKKRSFYKDYLALTQASDFSMGRVSLNLRLAHSLKNKKKMVVVDAFSPHAQGQFEKTWDAISHVLPLCQTLQKNNLVMIRIETGVTHQIRVSLQALGHPVLEDPIYVKPGEKPRKILEDKNMLSPLDQKTQTQMKTIVKKSGIGNFFSQDFQHIPEVLPPGGFFLHAFHLALKKTALSKMESLTDETLNQLTAGIYAKPPTWFGF